MIGLVNNAILEVIREDYGEGSCASIKQMAGLDIEHFSRMRFYPDEMTYRLIDEFSDALSMSPEQIWRDAGRHWFSGIAEDYGAFLRLAGGYLQDFLSNLNQVHTLMSLIFPRLCPPSFHCENLAPGDIRLHCYNKNKGLAFLTIGILQGLMEHLQLDGTSGLEEGQVVGEAHDVFRIRWSLGVESGVDLNVKTTKPCF